MFALGRILMTDNEEVFLRSTTALLRQEGYECDTVSNADAAIEKLHASDYDLLIADINMPGNSEFEFVRAAPKIAPGLPIILITGQPSLATALLSFRLPVVAYLSKPVDAKELLDHVKSAIEQANISRAVRSSQERLQNWCESLRSVDQYMVTNSRGSAVRSTLNFLKLTRNNIVGCLADLENVATAMAVQRANLEPCHLLNCPKIQKLTASIVETIEVLEKTKHAFKSKDLGELRKKLETVVKNEA